MNEKTGERCARTFRRTGGGSGSVRIFRSMSSLFGSSLFRWIPSLGILVVGSCPNFGSTGCCSVMNFSSFIFHRNLTMSRPRNRRSSWSAVR